MRALIMFVSGLGLIVAFLAVTTKRREMPTAAVTTADTPAPDNVSTPEQAQTMVAATLMPRAPRTVAGPAPDAASASSSYGVTVDQAAARIASSSGRPSVVILYGTGCPLSIRMFPDFVAMMRRHPGVEVIAFATDEESADDVPGFLQSNGAPFPPSYIRNWPPGELTRAMAPFGIQVGTPWTRPLVAVRDANGRVIAQGQGVTNIAAIEQALGQLR